MFYGANEVKEDGGFSGETLKLKEINSEQISEKDKKRLNDLLVKTDFFNLNQAKLKKMKRR